MSSNDADATLAALEPLAEAQGHLDPPPVGGHRPERLLRDRGVRRRERPRDALRPGRARASRSSSARPPDCEGRADCEGGLTDVYGLEITEIVPLDFASAQVKDAVPTARCSSARPAPPTAPWRTSAWCCSRTTRASSRRRTSPRRSTPTSWPTTPTSRTCSTSSPTALTTEDLAEMNDKVDLERQKPEDVATGVPRGQGPDLSARPAGDPSTDPPHDPADRRRQDLRRRHGRGAASSTSTWPGRVRGAGRPVGLRQVDDAEDDQPADRADHRQHRDRRRRTSPTSTRSSCAAASATSSSRSGCSRTRRSSPT